MSFLTSIRKLFETDDSAPRDSAAAAASGVPIPGDYAHRLRSLMALGWTRKLSEKALVKHAYSIEQAAEWLRNNHAYEWIPPAAPDAATAASTSSSSSSSAAAAAASVPMEIETIPTVYERLPPLPTRNNNAMSISDDASSSAASSSSSSAPASASSMSSYSSASASASASSISVTPSPTPSQQQSSIWSCGVCTYENSIDRARCEMCETAKPLSAYEATLKECQICYTLLPKDDMFMDGYCSDCQHYTCTDCARTYLRSKLESGQSLARINCVGDKCSRVLTTEEVRAGLDDFDFARFERFRRIAELSDDPRVVWCPNSKCEVALIHSGESRLQCPDCKQSCCFTCKTPWHQGLTCEAYQHQLSLQSEQSKLAAMSTNDRLFQKFLSKNEGHFRQCQKCSVWVERTEGCMKMTCRCGYQWCFKCGSIGAQCTCTPFGHVFYPHETVMNNWGRGNVAPRPANGAPAAPAPTRFRLGGITISH